MLPFYTQIIGHYVFLEPFYYLLSSYAGGVSTIVLEGYSLYRCHFINGYQKVLYNRIQLYYFSNPIGLHFYSCLIIFSKPGFLLIDTSYYFQSYKISISSILLFELLINAGSELKTYNPLAEWLIRQVVYTLEMFYHY